jgi:hypothetical protein
MVISEKLSAEIFCGTLVAACCHWTTTYATHNYPKISELDGIKLPRKYRAHKKAFVINQLHFPFGIRYTQDIT